MTLSETLIGNFIEHSNSPSNKLYYNNGMSFKDFLFKHKSNGALIYLSLILVLTEFIVFKYFYPTVGFINGDSYSYLGSSFYNLRVDTYPIGYPKFLRFISVFSYSDTFLAGVQFFFTELALLFLIFSLFYFYNLNKWIRIAIVILTIPNPVIIYLSNYVCSDALFLGLSFVFFGSIVWILNRPKLGVVILHSVVIVFAFMVRYNALFYPIITLFVFSLNRRKLLIKFFGAIAVLSSIFLFIGHTKNEFKRLSGISQFSPFSGWQLANNALYAYRFVDSSERKKMPNSFIEVTHTLEITLTQHAM